MNIKAVEDYLTRHAAKQLKGGKSGAQVYDIEGKYVLKCIQREKLENEALYKAYQREALWYEYAAGSGFSCLPKIFDIRNTDDEIMILMRRYRNLSREKMDDSLLRKIIEVLAAVHTAVVPSFLRQEWHTAWPLTDTQINEAVVGWRAVLGETPNDLDKCTLEEIAAKINEIIRWHDSEEVVLNHGDFHWDNLLQDEQGNIIICDWQGVSAGQASGDLSFFFSRLRGDGIRLDERETVRLYEQAVKQLSGKIVTWETINGHICAANIITSFMFWHQYLHNSPKERVQEIYEKMVECFSFWKGIM